MKIFIFSLKLHKLLIILNIEVMIYFRLCYKNMIFSLIWNHETIARIKLKDIKFKAEMQVLETLVSISLIQITPTSFQEPTSHLFTSYF